MQGCHDAFLDWRQRSLEARADIVRAIGQELETSKEEFAQLMTREVGKLIGDSRDEISLCTAICQFTAENGPEKLADEERDIPGGTGVVHYAPIGVNYGIQPWNFPCYQVARYAIANLMAGNGVLLKHAENCTGSGLYLRDLMERAGLPENLFTVLIIDHDQSDRVIENDLVRGVTLTGSDGAGRIVAQKAAEQLKKTVVELGSNDAYVVLDDADVDTAVDACVTAVSTSASVGASDGRHRIYGGNSPRLSIPSRTFEGNATSHVGLHERRSKRLRRGASSSNRTFREYDLPSFRRWTLQPSVSKRLAKPSEECGQRFARRFIDEIAGYLVHRAARDRYAGDGTSRRLSQVSTLGTFRSVSTFGESPASL